MGSDGISFENNMVKLSCLVHASNQSTNQLQAIDTSQSIKLLYLSFVEWSLK